MDPADQTRYEKVAEIESKINNRVSLPPPPDLWNKVASIAADIQCYGTLMLNFAFKIVGFFFTKGL